MKWRSTLALLALLAIVLLIVLGRERQRQDSGEERLARGLLYPHSTEELRWIELAYPEQTLRVERTGPQAAWRLTSPVRDLGDSVVIGRMVATLEGQKVERWLPPVPVDSLARYGLAAPRLELHLGRKAGADTLRFGDLNAVEKRLWASTSWRDSLALVSVLLRTHFLKGRYELGDKRPLAGVALDKLESMELVNARGRFSLRRGELGWEIHRPEVYRADDATVSRMIEALWGESILGFASESVAEAGLLGFSTPRATLTLRLRGDNRDHRLELGRAHFELSYARNTDREYPFLLDSLTYAPLLESFSAFLSVVLVRFLPGQVLEIKGSDGAQALRDLSADWLWVDADGHPLKGREAAVLLGRMMRLPTGRVEALLPRQDQLEAWGLAPPRLSLQLRLKEGRAFTVELGRSQHQHTPVRRTDYPTVYSVPDSLLYLPWPLALEPGGR